MRRYPWAILLSLMFCTQLIGMRSSYSLPSQKPQPLYSSRLPMPIVKQNGKGFAPLRAIPAPKKISGETIGDPAAKKSLTDLTAYRKLVQNKLTKQELNFLDGIIGRLSVLLRNYAIAIQAVSGQKRALESANKKMRITLAEAAKQLSIKGPSALEQQLQSKPTGAQEVSKSAIISGKGSNGSTELETLQERTLKEFGEVAFKKLSKGKPLKITDLDDNADFMKQVSGGEIATLASASEPGEDHGEQKDLQATLAQTKLSLAKLSEENEQLKQRVAEITDLEASDQQDGNKKQKSVQELSAKNAELKQQLAGCKAAGLPEGEKDVRIGSLQADLDEATKKVKELEESVESDKKSLESCTAELDSLKNSLKDYFGNEFAAQLTVKNVSGAISAVDQNTEFMRALLRRFVREPEEQDFGASGLFGGG